MHALRAAFCTRSGRTVWSTTKSSLRAHRGTTQCLDSSTRSVRSTPSNLGHPLDLTLIWRLLRLTVVRKGFRTEGVRKEHHRFLSEFGLDEVDVPLVELNTLEWEHPLTPIVPQYG